MPNYTSPGQAQLLQCNRQGILWSFADTVAAPQLSIAYQLERRPGIIYPWGCSFELTFSGAPGNFEVDLVGANTDASPNYILLGSITQASNTGVVSGGYVYRYDMAANDWPVYVAGYLKSLANSVKVALTVQH